MGIEMEHDPQEPTTKELGDLLIMRTVIDKLDRTLELLADTLPKEFSDVLPEEFSWYSGPLPTVTASTYPQLWVAGTKNKVLIHFCLAGDHILGERILQRPPR